MKLYPSLLRWESRQLKILTLLRQENLRPWTCLILCLPSRKLSTLPLRQWEWRVLTLFTLTLRSRRQLTQLIRRLWKEWRHTVRDLLWSRASGSKPDSPAVRKNPLCGRCPKVTFAVCLDRFRIQVGEALKQPILRVTVQLTRLPMVLRLTLLLPLLVCPWAGYCTYLHFSREIWLFAPGPA